MAIRKVVRWKLMPGNSQTGPCILPPARKN